MVARRLLLFLSFAVAAPTAAHAGQPAGRVVSVRGDVTCRLNEGGVEPIARGYQVEAGDTLETGASASARIVMSDKSILALGPNTEMRVAAYGRKKRSAKFSARLKLGAGRIWARVSKWLGGNERKFEVETGNAVAGVRGTEFVVHVDDSGKTNVWVVEGEVEMGSPGDGPGSGADGQLVGANQHGSVGADGQVQVADVTADQVVEQVGSVGGGSTGDDDGTREEEAAAGADEEAEEDGDEDGDEEEDSDETDTDEEVPEIELDPGSGNARVRGRIEVRD